MVARHLTAATLAALTIATLTGCNTTAAPTSATGSPLAVIVPADPATSAMNALLNAPVLPTTTAGEAVFKAASACGVNRWAVKTGTDVAAKQVDVRNVTKTSIEALRAFPAPSPYPKVNNSRVSTPERTAYQITGTLIGYKKEADGDYHLIVEDSQGRTMVIELPNAGCVGATSPWRPAISTVRGQFDGQFKATSSLKKTRRTITVTGVGFFDRLHGAGGAAPNAIELHPVLSLTFP